LLTVPRGNSSINKRRARGESIQLVLKGTRECINVDESERIQWEVHERSKELESATM
jgi:hypothetical protein